MHKKPLVYALTISTTKNEKDAFFPNFTAVGAKEITLVSGRNSSCVIQAFIEGTVQGSVLALATIWPYSGVRLSRQLSRVPSPAVEEILVICRGFSPALLHYSWYTEQRNTYLTVNNHRFNSADLLA